MVTSCVYILRAYRFKMADSKKISKGQRLNEEETEVIELWSQQEVLFNCTHKDYFKRDARATAINVILSQLNIEGKFVIIYA